MKFLYKLRRPALWTGTILFSVILLAVATVSVFQDKIIAIVVAELNKNLTTEVKVDNRIEVSLLTKFPHVSIEFKDVHFKDPIEKEGPDLASVKKVYLAFNPLDLIFGSYQIERIYLENGKVNIRVDENGNANYNILKQDTSAQNEDIGFDLNKIVLLDVMVNVDHIPGSQRYSLLSKNSSASVHLEENIYKIIVDGDFHVYDIKISGESYFEDKEVHLSLHSDLFPGESKFSIHPAEIIVENSKFNISGYFTYSDDSDIHLNIEGEKGKIQTLLSLLPSSVYNKVNVYESEGEVFFKGGIYGKSTDSENPLIKFDFGFQNAAFYHPELKGRIEKAEMKGYFTNGSHRNSKTSVLKLSKVSAIFQGKKISGDFEYANFIDPNVKLSANGSIDIGSILNFYPVPDIPAATGLVHFSIFFDGRLEDLKTSEGKNRVEANGEVLVKNLNFSVKGVPYKFSAFNGHFLFNKNDIAINEFRGLAGRSDFLISGYFRNVISSLIFHNQKMAVEGSLRSYNLDLDELLPRSSRQTDSEIDLKILDMYDVDLSCKISHVRYRRFNITNLNGEFQSHFPSANFRNMKLTVGGGDINFDTHIKVGNNGSAKVHTTARFDSLHADSLFYVFNDFEQTFLTHKNLKGKISGTADIHTPLDSKLNVIFPDIDGKVTVSVLNGQLNDFSPMQKLSLFIQEHELYNVRFSEMKNEVHFSGNKIFIPEMEIRSNVSNIMILGTHSFDNEMDYKFTVPLKNFKGKDKDEAFGAVEEDAAGTSKVFLTLKGTPDNFKYGYDTRRTWEKNKIDLKREGDELSDIINNRYKRRHVDQPKDAELNQDDYFNFDD